MESMGHCDAVGCLRGKFCYGNFKGQDGSMVSNNIQAKLPCNSITSNFQLFKIALHLCFPHNITLIFWELFGCSQMFVVCFFYPDEPSQSHNMCQAHNVGSTLFPENCSLCWIWWKDTRISNNFNSFPDVRCKKLNILPRFLCKKLITNHSMYLEDDIYWIYIDRVHKNCSSGED